MSELVSVVGSSFPITHKGKTYNLHQWNDRLRSRYVQWAKSYAMQTLRGLLKDKVFTGPEYQEAFNGLRRDLVNGEYEFGKPAIQSLISTTDGFHILVRVLLDDDSVQDDEIKSLIDERGEELFTIIADLNGGGEVEEATGDEAPKA